MQTSPWLRFLVRDQAFALPLSAVAEVANASAPRLIPQVPHELGGVVNFRGEPLPALDGAALFGAEAGGVRRHLVVLGDARLRIGLLVSEVLRIERSLDGAVALDEPEPRPPEFAEWVRFAGEPLGLIAPEELLDRATKLLTEQRIQGGTMPWHDAF